MCGVVGLFDTLGNGRADQATVERMTECVAHRGPDSVSHLVDRNIAFGFRRLSIIDPMGGQQPMWNEDRSVVSICNGEIFNYKDIRRSLETKGHCFTTQCDVEVLPHLYEEYGLDFLQHLDGQFAFGLYDKRRDLLVAGRDHFGVVPLFFTIVDGIFMFASEIKAILSHPLVRREVNLEGLDQILCFPGLISPTTMFAGISSLKSGHFMLVSSRGIETREYWDLDYPRENDKPRAKDEAYYAEGIEEHLRRSVRKRLMSDVPLGVYLSGGLDSSIVAALLRDAAPAAHRLSFGISFKGDKMCEAQYQRRMSEFLSTEHHEVPFGPGDIVDRLERTIYHTECPIKETYDTACLALSKATKDSGVSVVLTGQGADELFGGYIGYRFDEFYNGRTRVGANEQQEQVIRKRLWGDPLLAYDGDYCSLQAVKRKLYSRALREKAANADCLRSLPIRQDRIAGRHVFHKRSYLDFKLRLADHLLGDHGDRMSMANAVEARHPFLDLDLIRFVREIPPELKLKELTEKYILRQAARGIVPSEIIKRQKFAWFAHGSPHLIHSGKPHIQDLLCQEKIRKQGYFDVQAIEELKSRYSTKGFALNQPFDTDVLAIVLSFTAFIDVFNLPYLN